MTLAALARVASGSVLLAVACRGSAPATRHHEVVIEGLAFSPATLAVRAGDTVTWINRDVVPHTATGPDGAWDSGLLVAGARFTTVIGETGPGTYRCAYHPVMTGELRRE